MQQQHLVSTLAQLQLLMYEPSGKQPSSRAAQSVSAAAEALFETKTVSEIRQVPTLAALAGWAYGSQQDLVLHTH